jgi:hypothetical protein
MNRRQFAILLVALVLIGSAGLIVINRHNESWNVRETKVGDKLLPNFRPNDIAAIHIKGLVDLNVENKDGVWCVKERGNYPANYDRIKNLLLRIKDIKVVQSDDIGPSQRARVELEEPGKGVGSGTLVEFKDAGGKVLDSLLVGKRHLRPETASDPFRMRGLFDGCYVLLPKEPQNVLLISDELAGISAEPGAWLNTEFCKIENVKSIALAGSGGANLWTLLRASESKPWSLADANPSEVLDVTKAAQSAELLNFLAFVDIISNAVPTEHVLMEQKELKIETFAHFFYTLQILSQREGMFQVALGVRAEIQPGATALQDKLGHESRFATNGWNYMVESKMLEPLLCERANLIQKTELVRAKASGDL